MIVAPRVCRLYPQPWFRRHSAGMARVALYVHHAYIPTMEDLRFEWDPVKARANLRKHGVSFEEAQTAFADEFALVVDDPIHSDHEARFVLLGLSARLRLLMVVHCYRAAPEVIRLISAQPATPSERAQYGAHRGL